MPFPIICPSRQSCYLAFICTDFVMVHSWYSGNQVAVLETGSEFFPALLHAIEHASQEIHLETYIFRIDSASQPIAMALAAAAQRGVRCYVLVDGFG